jgi:type II secretion system protein J
MKSAPQNFRAPGRTGGFTLIELVISGALMSMILVSAYVCFNAAMATEKTVDARTETLQNARVAMARMSADLRGACPLSKDFAFLGMRHSMGDIDADNLDFATHNYTPRRPHEGDFCEVSYFLDKNRESGRLSLWRRRNPMIALEPLKGGRREEIVPGVVGLRFEYYDGLDWYEQWGDADTDKPRAGRTAKSDASNMYGMPEAVRITLWLDTGPQANAPAGSRTNEPPLMFQTVARLNLAAVSDGQTTRGGSSTNAAPTTNPGQGGQGLPTGGGN